MKINHVARDACKVERVINSCETYNQAVMAHNMKCFFCKTYPESKFGDELHTKAVRVLRKFSQLP